MSSPKLAAKLSEVMGAVERVAKRGRNQFHGYDYVTEADLADAIRSELSKRKVMLVPSVKACEMRDMPPTAKGKAQFLTTVMVEWTFTDGESGEMISFDMPGFGIDGEDKGGYKALTGSEKYALMKVFLVPTGDDPEQDERPVQRQSTPKPQDVSKPVDRAPATNSRDYIKGFVADPKDGKEGIWFKVGTESVFAPFGVERKGLAPGDECELAIERMTNKKRQPYCRLLEVLTIVPKEESVSA